MNTASAGTAIRSTVDAVLNAPVRGGGGRGDWCLHNPAGTSDAGDYTAAQGSAAREWYWSTTSHGEDRIIGKYGTGVMAPVCQKSRWGPFMRLWE